MQATVRTTWFGIDRIKLTLVVAGLLVSGIAATSIISLTGVGGDDANSLARDVAVVEPAHHPIDRGAGLAWEHSTLQSEKGTEALEANGLPVAPMVSKPKPSGTEDLEANGLPIALHTASDSGLDRADQMERFVVAKEARQDALELEASTLAERTAQDETMRRYYAHKEAQIDSRP